MASSSVGCGWKLRATSSQLAAISMAMVAYNFINHRFVDEALRMAREKDFGVIVMKVSRGLQNPFLVDVLVADSNAGDRRHLVVVDAFDLVAGFCKQLLGLPVLLQLGLQLG